LKDLKDKLIEEEKLKSLEASDETADISKSSSSQTKSVPQNLAQMKI